MRLEQAQRDRRLGRSAPRRARVGLRRGRPRRARGRGDDGRRRAGHAAECPAQGLHRGPRAAPTSTQRAGREGGERAGRAGELRPVLHRSSRAAWRALDGGRRVGAIGVERPARRASDEQLARDGDPSAARPRARNDHASSASTSARPASRRSRSRPTARCSRARRRSYPLSTPQPGWAEQDPEDWWRATEAALARSGAATRRDRALGADARPRRARRRRATCCGPRSSGTTSARRAECAEIEARRRPRAADRADRQPRARRASRRRSCSGCAAHEPEVYARIRHVLLPKDYVRLRLTGEHAIDAADASGTLLFDVAQPALVRRGARGARDPAEWLPRVLESPEVSGARGGSGRGGRRRPGRRRARRRRRPARARSRSCSAPPASSSPRCPATRPTARAACTSFCHAVPGTWHAMGVMLSAAGSLRWLRDVAAPGEAYDALVAEAERLGARRRGAAVRAVPLRRADAARRPGRARRVHRPLAPPRPRRARRARCSRASPTACATRSSCCASSASSPRSAASPGGGARSELWLRIVASVLDLPLERTAAEDGAAFGAALLGGVARRRVRRRPRGGRALRPRHRADRARPRVGRRVRARLRSLPLAVSGTRPLEDT